MTDKQLAAWLHSLFRDPNSCVLSGWCEEYTAGSTQTVDGEVNFEALAFEIITKFKLPIDLT